MACAAAAYMLPSTMAMILESKRKRDASRVGFTYGPMDERDRMRIEYLNLKIWKDDNLCKHA